MAQHPSILLLKKDVIHTDYDQGTRNYLSPAYQYLISKPI